MILTFRIELSLITGYSIIESKSGSAYAQKTISTPANEISVSETYKFADSNISIEIASKPIEYTIEYKTDGGTISGTYPTKYVYGTETVLPTKVTKTGCTFYGWKDKSGTIVYTISRTQSGNQVYTAIWEDPTLGTLPSGTNVVASLNGKYLRITYPSRAEEDVDLYAQRIVLYTGKNEVKFKMNDGKYYKANVDYKVPIQMQVTMKAEVNTGNTTIQLLILRYK